MRFLVDECLCHQLVWIAQYHGYEADHVDLLRLKGTSDEALMPRIVTGDYTFVTNNARDFLRLFALQEKHEGLIILLPNGPIPVQIELFEAVLDDLHRDGAMQGRSMEVDFASADDGNEADIVVRRFDLGAGDA